MQSLYSLIGQDTWLGVTPLIDGENVHGTQHGTRIVGMVDSDAIFCSTIFSMRRCLNPH